MELDAKQQAVNRVLTTKGTPLRINEAAVLPFWDQYTFYKFPESTLVSLGGRVIRDTTVAASEKERLLNIIRRSVLN